MQHNSSQKVPIVGKWSFSIGRIAHALVLAASQSTMEERRVVRNNGAIV